MSGACPLGAHPDGRLTSSDLWVSFTVLINGSAFILGPLGFSPQRPGDGRRSWTVLPTPTSQAVLSDSHGSGTQGEGLGQALLHCL